MEEQPRAKYNYRFSLTSGKGGEVKDSGDSAEVQSYINEILGIGRKRSEGNVLQA